MQKLSLSVELTDGTISEPFLGVEIKDELVPMFLIDVGRLAKYFPIRVLVGEAVVTGVHLTAEKAQILGQPIQWRPK